MDEPSESAGSATGDRIVRGGLRVAFRRRLAAAGLLSSRGIQGASRHRPSNRSMHAAMRPWSALWWKAAHGDHTIRCSRFCRSAGHLFPFSRLERPIPPFVSYRTNAGRSGHLQRNRASRLVLQCRNDCRPAPLRTRRTGRCGVAVLVVAGVVGRGRCGVVASDGELRQTLSREVSNPGEDRRLLGWGIGDGRSPGAGPWGGGLNGAWDAGARFKGRLSRRIFPRHVLIDHHDGCSEQQNRQSRP